MRHEFKRNSKMRNICNAIDLMIQRNQLWIWIDQLIDEGCDNNSLEVKRLVSKSIICDTKSDKYIKSLI